MEMQRADTPKELGMKSVRTDKAFKGTLNRSPMKTLSLFSFVFASTVFCAAVPFWTLDIGLKGFTSSSVLQVSSLEAASSEKTSAERLTERLKSKDELIRTISDLQLMKGDLIGFEQQSQLGLLLDLVRGHNPSSTEMQDEAAEALRNAFNISSPEGTNAVLIAAISTKPETAKRIADYLSMRIIAEPTLLVSNNQMSTLDNARQIMDRDNAALDTISLLNKQLSAQTMSVAVLEQERNLLSDQLNIAKSLTVMNIATKFLPDTEHFVTVSDVRTQYLAAKQVMDTVSIEFGPKHPKSLGAQASLEKASAQLSTAIKQAVTEIASRLNKSDNAYKTAKIDEQTLIDKLQSFGEIPAELSKLQSNLAQSRQAHLNDSVRTGANQAPVISLIQPALNGNKAIDRYEQIKISGMAGILGFVLSCMAIGLRRKKTIKQPEKLALVSQTTLVTERVDHGPKSVEPLFSVDDALMEELIHLDIVEYERLERAAAQKAHADKVAISEQVEPQMELRSAANSILLDEMLHDHLLNQATPASAVNVDEMPPLMQSALQGNAYLTEEQKRELSALKDDLRTVKRYLNSIEQDKRYARQRASA